MRFRVITIATFLLLGHGVLMHPTALGDTEIGRNIADGWPFDFNGYTATWTNANGRHLYKAEVSVAGNQLTSTGQIDLAITGSPKGGPRIHGDRVVWMDSRGGFGDIYYKQPPVASAPEIQVPDAGPGDQWFPSLHGDNVVWWDKRSGGWEVHGYNFATDERYVVPAPPQQEHLFPEIWENKVVWKYGNDKVGVCDITTMNVQTINMAPNTTVVNDDFDIYDYVAVWHTATSGAEPSQAFHVYDLLTDEEHLIEWTDDGPRSSPKIFENLVVWADKRNGNWDIYGYDLTLQHEFQITDEPWDQITPNIWDDVVVWADNRREGDSWDIYGKVIPEPATLALLALGGIVVLRRR